MKTPIAILLLALVPVSVATAQKTPAHVADSNIAEVTVYQDRAAVTRIASIALEPGLQDVVFTGLPNSIDPNLLQVSGEGTADASILDVTASRVQLSKTADPRLEELLEKSRDLRDILNSLNQRRSILSERTQFLNEIRSAAVTPPVADGATLPNVEEWQALLAFYSEGKREVIDAGIELDREIADTRAELTAIQREINELRASGSQTQQNVTVRLDVANAGTMDLELDYTVVGASWSPTYEVRVASETKSIDIGYSALVRQSTGEDWDNVQLTLSTARPALGGTPPELYPWFLDEMHLAMQVRALGGVAEMEAVPPPAASKADMAYAANETIAGTRVRTELKQLQATVSMGLTSATFAIEHPADIPADNDTHKVAVTRHTMEGELTHLAVPKLAQLAYLQATVENTSEFPLIAGPVSLYLDGTYVARSNLETVMPQEEFDLDLGVDDAISIERKLVNRLREETGLVSRKQRITYDVLITVKNNHRTAQNVVVEDQLPIARHEYIAVELLKPPSREIKQDEEGRITWQLELQPGEERELSLQISVEYPNDFQINGLE